MVEIKHGGNLIQAMEAYGGQISDWLDISTGISPFSAPLPDMSQEVWRRLPEADMILKLEQEAQKFYLTNIPCLAVSGSQFVINLLPMLLVEPVGIIEPTYLEYANAFNREKKEYKSLKGLDDTGDVKSVILAHPNNPDGRIFTASCLIKLASKLADRGGQLVVDEAFCDMTCEHSLLPLLEEGRNIIIMRSFGKFFGLAGIRLGFVFCSREMQDKIMDYRGPWSISGPAIAVARYIFSHLCISQQLRQKIHTRYQEMRMSLMASGLDIVGHNPLFFLISHPQAGKLHEYLMVNHILTRKFDYNKYWIRVGLTSNQQEDRRFCNVIQSFEGSS